MLSYEEIDNVINNDKNKILSYPAIYPVNNGLSNLSSNYGYRRDPFSKNRSPNDRKWALDHFFKKLLLLENMMNTKIGKIEAKKRTKVLQNYLNALKKEI